MRNLKQYFADRNRPDSSPITAGDLIELEATLPADGSTPPVPAEAPADPNAARRAELEAELAKLN